jgi:hypothetical protein
LFASIVRRRALVAEVFVRERTRQIEVVEAARWAADGDRAGEQLSTASAMRAECRVQ